MKALDALCYVKIGRVDVQSSDSTVKRFSFSHRRYQEALFAACLREDDSILPIDALVLDSRWREYFVAVLQMGDSVLSQKILSFASDYLEAAHAKIVPRSHRFFGVDITSYAWDSEELKRLLGALQEGLAGTFPEGARKLGKAVNVVAAKLWTRGDLYDRLQVMRLCSAVRADELARRVEIAMSSGLTLFEEAGLSACRFVSVPTKNLAGWVRRNVLARLVMASKGFEYFRWDAVAADLPANFEMASAAPREGLKKSPQVC